MAKKQTTPAAAGTVGTAIPATNDKAAASHHVIPSAAGTTREVEEPARELTVEIGSFRLECGVTLQHVTQRVAIYGEPKSDGSNVAFVAHALTGSSRVADWWPALLTNGAPLDLRRWCIAGVNILGGCYGSTGPQSPDENGKPYNERFPLVTVRDAVRAQQLALAELGIPDLALVIGASLGGMQALQWALDFPSHVRRAIIVGAGDHQSPMAIAFNSIQRDAIAVEPRQGIRIARKIAMLTYKSEELLRARHDRKPDRNASTDRYGMTRYDVEGYLEHQADVFEARMDPQSYVSLTRTMDSQDVREHTLRADPTDSAKSLPELLFIGISSDWLFRPQDVRAAAERFAGRGFHSSYRELESDHGHDAFLAQPQALAKLLNLEKR